MDIKLIIDDALGDGAKILSGLKNKMSILESNKRLISIERRYLIIDQMIDIREKVKTPSSSTVSKMASNCTPLLSLSSVKMENAQIGDKILKVTEEGDINENDIITLEKCCTGLEKRLGIDNLLTKSWDEINFKDRRNAISQILGVPYEETPLNNHEQLESIFAAEQRELAAINAEIATVNKNLLLLECVLDVENKPEEIQQKPIESNAPRLIHTDLEINI